MKKIFLFVCCIFMFFMSGCAKLGEKDLIKELKNKISSEKNYQLIANLEIFRNEERFSYDVVSTFQKGDYFKVQLINKENNHEQIILKNRDSVYVLTPSLNKSFKFQSDWPYNNSQIYLLQPIILDVEKDQKRSYEKTKTEKIIISDVNYSSEKDFKKQKIYFDKNNNITRVEVLDSNKNIKMCLKIINMQYNIDLSSDFFDINKYIKKSLSNDNNTTKEKNKNKIEESIKLNEIVYPMYIPADTYLYSQNVVYTDSGERAILNFAGESNFTLIQETVDNGNDINYVYGDPYLVLDTMGIITDSSISWISKGVEYSIVSDTMSIDELLTVAQSIGVEPISK